MARSPRSSSPLRTPTTTSALAGRPARTTVTRAAERRWLLVNANPMKPSKDREAAVVASFVDVTPRANAIIAEKERTALLDRQRAELERSNAELEQFAYVTSHDLSEPLRVIHGFTQLLAEELGDNLDPVVQEYCGFITDATGRMQALIADLLTYSRVGRAVTEAVPVELDAVLADVGDLLGPTAADEGGELKIGPAVGTVVGHAPELVQLFQNLVSNGLKFHHAGVAPVVHVTGAVADGRATVVVDDNGIGIEPKYRDQIFQMFQRLHGRTAYPGTGIGLALCRKIAGTHGGTITVGDSPLGGSRFTVSLPSGEGFG